jgi:hypothetical protein
MIAHLDPMKGDIAQMAGDLRDLRDALLRERGEEKARAQFRSRRDKISTRRLAWLAIAATPFSGLLTAFLAHF